MRIVFRRCFLHLAQRYLFIMFWYKLRSVKFSSHSVRLVGLGRGSGILLRADTRDAEAEVDQRCSRMKLAQAEEAYGREREKTRQVAEVRHFGTHFRAGVRTTSAPDFAGAPE